MKRISLAILAVAVLAACTLPERANAQLATVVSVCPGSRTTPYPLGTTVPLTVDVNGNLCAGVSVTASASISGFTPIASPRMTPFTVTTSDSSGTLPVGASTVIVYNTGANPMYCNVNGVAATIADAFISAGGGGFPFTIPGGSTTLHCIATGGSTTANGTGGSGIATGWGAGSAGGGGGGAVTMAANSISANAYAVGAVQAGAFALGSLASGAIVDLGAIADSASAAGGVGTVNAKLRLMTTQLGTINSTLGSPLQAGGAVTASSATSPVSTMNSASAGTGINAALAAVFDDVTPTAITENNFGAVRMSANRNLYSTIRDAGGNERGANVDGTNRLTTAPTIVSGAVNAGAYASGSYAAGALASGSIASGAMVDLLTFQGSKAAGTAAANSLLIGGVFNTSLPSLTTGQQAGIQMDSGGRIYVTGTGGSFPSTLAAETTKVIGTVRNLGNAGAITDFAGQNAASPANAWLFGCQFNTTPTTITNGNASPCQVDNAGNVLVNVKNANSNGAAATTGSSPVTTATDQRVSTANGTTNINISSATTTQLVGVSGSTSIYVTSYRVMASGTGTFALSYGTGTNCATGLTTIDGPFSLTAQAGLAPGSGVGSIVTIPSGKALCATTTGAGTWNGSVTTQQF